MVDRVDSLSSNRQPSAGGAPTGSVLNARDVKAWKDAFEFLNEAEKQIADQRKDAEETASRLYASERARGYEDGKAEATSLIAETTLKVDRYLQSIEPQVAKLAMSVVHRVLGNFDTGDLVAAAAGQAIADLRREKRLTVTVHPDAVARVSQEFARLGVSGRIEVTIEGNPSLDPTACIIASDLAVIDASIKTQLAAIATALGAI
jgi:type III secretion protein L